MKSLTPFKIIALLSWPFFINDFYLIAISNSHLGLLWSLDIIFFTTVPTVTLYYLNKTGNISFGEIGFSKSLPILSITLGIILCFVLIVTIRWGINPSLYKSLPWRLSPNYGFPPNQPTKTITIVYAALSAGILEEIIFRGVVTNQLRKVMTSESLIFFTGCLFFALIHWSNGPAKIISTFLWACIPTIWYMKRKDIWGPMSCHIAYDYLVFANIV